MAEAEEAEAEERRRNSLFLNFEELEGRDDVKGINRGKKERERGKKGKGPFAGRSVGPSEEGRRE